MNVGVIICLPFAPLIATLIEFWLKRIALLQSTYFKGFKEFDQGLKPWTVVSGTSQALRKVSAYVIIQPLS